MTETSAAPVVVTAPVELDVHTHSAYRYKLRHPIETGAPFVIADLASTTFLDNLGLGVLVGALRLARERGCRFGVAASASEHVMNTFTITGLTRVFDIRSTTEAFTADEAGEDQARS